MTMKSARFHEICQISWPWNPPDSMKSTGFHGHEIHQILPWNLADFMIPNEPRTNGPILAHLALPKWAYIIMIHEMDPHMGLWFRLCGICVICVCSSWPQYWLHELPILLIYHIMLMINAHEIFSWCDLYFFAGSYFAQNLKMALLSLSLNLEIWYCTQ